MKLNGKDLLKYIHNTVDCSVDDDGNVIPFRFTSEQIKAYKKLSTNIDFGKNAVTSTNVTIDLNTDSDILGLEFLPEVCIDKGFFSFDLLVNGRLFASEYITNYNTKIIAFRLPEGFNHIQLFFPWNAKIEIKNLILNDNCKITPVLYDRTIIAFGDSITQGYIVDHPCLSYVGRITNICNAEVLNQGVGGFFFDDESLDTELKKFNPNCIIIGYGTNDASCLDDLDEIIANQKKYLEKLRAIFPETRMLAFLPIWGNDPRLKARNLIRSFSSDGVNRGLAEVYTEYNVETVRDYFYPRINDFYSPDLVHPNTIGGILMGDEIVAALNRI